MPLPRPPLRLLRPPRSWASRCLVPGLRLQRSHRGRGHVGQAEHANRRHLGLGLLAQALGGVSDLLNQRSIALRALVHVLHGGANLRHACALLGAGAADFLHQRRGVADGIHRVGDGAAHAVHLGCTLGSTRHAGVDEQADLLG